MTDAVNKQALNTWIKDRKRVNEGLRDGAVERNDFIAAALAQDNNSELGVLQVLLECGKFDSPPAPPVQGYREAQWIVYDVDDGLICTSSNYDEALREYEEQVVRVKDFVQDNGEFSVDLSERVVMAMIVRQVYPVKIAGDTYDWHKEVQALSQTDIQPSGWIPIESAPKDGTDILVLNDDGHVYEASWNGYMWRLASANQHGCGCCGGDEESPTHWMPLPVPLDINSTEDDQPGPSIERTNENIASTSIFKRYPSTEEEETE